MVVGTDIDALLSAAFLHHYYGWKVVDFYDLTRVHLAEGVTWEQARKAMWVDLDVAHTEVESIGHHILTWDRLSKQYLLTAHKRSLNPNLVRNIGQKDFTSKYPLSTILFLYWLADKPITLRDETLCLLWAADSSWQNMAKFTRNVRRWIEDWMPHPFLLETKEGWLQADYTQRMTRFTVDFNQNSPLSLADIVSYGITSPAKCPIGYTDTQIQLILNYVCDLLGWQRLKVPNKFQVIEGQRTPVKDVDWNTFALPSNVFSYAVRFSREINYTVFAAHDLK